MPPFECNHNGSCDNLRICCTETEMTLTKEDIERITGLGFRMEDFLIKADDGFHQLKNISGLCFFYDRSSKKCRIYENRPEGCMYYPIVYDLSRDTCTVDYDCPSGSTMTSAEIQQVCDRVRQLVRTLVSEANENE